MPFWTANVQSSNPLLVNSWAEMWYKIRFIIFCCWLATWSQWRDDPVVRGIKPFYFTPRMWITFLDKTYPTPPKVGMGMYLCKNLKWFVSNNILVGIHRGREGQISAKLVLHNFWMTSKLGNEKVFSEYSNIVWFFQESMNSLSLSKFQI